MSYPLTDIDGIDRTVATALKFAGIRSTKSLLEAASTANGRKELAGKTGFSERQLLQWANLAHFMSLRGVSREYAGLLQKSGVDTVKELKYRNPGKLVAAMARANKNRKLVKVLPSEKRVVRWIDDAKKLPPKITY
jgi:hypothetical protein